MFTIAIGEDSEYGQRLRKYLEAHWSGPFRIFSFTCPETLLDCKDTVDCYLLGETFYEKLMEGETDFYSSSFQDKCIILSDSESGRDQANYNEELVVFCRYHAPAELLTMIREMKHLSGMLQEKEKAMYSVTAVYSPVFDSELRQIASQFMKSGDLYLGMEDIGHFDRDKSHMGELCYFIGLEEENITSRVEELVWEEGERWYLDSPDIYYDLLEVSVDEYQRFFDTLREEENYRNIYVGLGSGMLAHLYSTTVFDHFILIDSKENQRLRTACDYFERMIQSGVKLFTGQYERRYREDVLYEPV